MDISQAYLLEQEKYNRKIMTKRCTCCLGFSFFLISLLFAKLQIYLINQHDNYLTDLSSSQ